MIYCILATDYPEPGLLAQMNRPPRTKHPWSIYQVCRQTRQEALAILDTTYQLILDSEDVFEFLVNLSSSSISRIRNLTILIDHEAIPFDCKNFPSRPIACGGRDRAGYEMLKQCTGLTRLELEVDHTYDHKTDLLQWVFGMDVLVQLRGLKEVSIRGWAKDPFIDFNMVEDSSPSAQMIKKLWMLPKAVCVHCKHNSKEPNEVTD